MESAMSGMEKPEMKVQAEGIKLYSREAESDPTIRCRFGFQFYLRISEYGMTTGPRKMLHIIRCEDILFQFRVMQGSTYIYPVFAAGQIPLECKVANVINGSFAFRSSKTHSGLEKTRYEYLGIVASAELNGELPNDERCLLLRDMVTFSKISAFYSTHDEPITSLKRKAT